MYQLKRLLVIGALLFLSACSFWQKNPDTPVVDFPDCAIDALDKVKNVDYEYLNSERNSVVARTPYTMVEIQLEKSRAGEELIRVESFGPKKELNKQESPIMHELLNLIMGHVTRVCGNTISTYE